eukprot:g3614.t1
METHREARDSEGQNPRAVAVPQEVKELVMKVRKAKGCLGFGDKLGKLQEALVRELAAGIRGNTSIITLRLDSNGLGELQGAPPAVPPLQHHDLANHDRVPGCRPEHGSPQTQSARNGGPLKLVANDLTMLIDTANAPTFGIDVDQLGRVDEWNQKAAEITECTSDEVMGRSLVQEFITPEYRTAVKAALDSALFGKATANFDFPLYTKTGRLLQVLLNANPRRDTNNKIVGVLGVGQDITERIAQEQEYVRLIDTANAPIFGIDDMGNVKANGAEVYKVKGDGSAVQAKGLAVTAGGARGRGRGRGRWG